MASPTASVQLIVFGSRNKHDFEGVLKDVAAAGFPAIEAGDLFADHGEATVRRLLAENGLGVSGAHFGYGDYADAARLDAHIAYAEKAGLKHLMCSGVSNTKTVEGYQESAKVFNAVGKRLAAAGMTFHYHNHAWEFEDLGGGVHGMQILAAETDPALVKFNIDVFWLYYADLDPAEFITKHADRAGYFHFKDGRKAAGIDGVTRPEFMELGRGEVDLMSAYTAAKAAGAEWIVAEQDSTFLTPLDAVTISRVFMQENLGI